MEKTNNVMGTELNQINHIYLQASMNNKIKKMYIRYNDGFVDSLTPKQMGVTEGEFAKAINDFFIAAGVSKVKDRDYSVRKANDRIFKDLNEIIAKQEKEAKSAYDLEKQNQKAIEKEVAASDFNFEPEGIENLRVADREAFDNIELDEENSKSNAKRYVLAGGIVTLALAIGSCALINGRASDDVVEAVVEASVDNTPVKDTPEKPSMEGQDFEYYVSYAPESVQKETMVKYHDYVMNFNRSEDWMYEKLTPEMIEELEKMSITIDGDEAIFGFTAEEVNALNLVFGTHTNEEYTKLLNGNYIDVTKVMSSSESEMNQAIRKVIVYYLNSDNAHIGIENVINFNNSEKEQIKRFEDMFQEYKDLLKENKNDDAEAKMKDIKVAMLEYAHAQDTEVNNAKPYILRTILPACSVYATSYQYTDKIILNLQDNATGKPVDKEVETWLFDEITMRDLVEGYQECRDEHGVVYQDGFSEIEFLNRLDIDSKKYSLIISDDGVSIADEFVGGLENKLNGANDYMEKLRTENSATDALVTASVEGADVSDNSELDTLTQDTYDSEQIFEMINNDLVKAEKYPKNLNFFTSIYSKFTKQVMAFKDAIYGKLSGTKSTSTEETKKVIKTIPGKTIYVPGTRQVITWTESWTETYTDTRVEHEKVSEEEIAKEDAKNRAAAVEKASKTTVTDGATGKQKDTTYQDIYNKGVNDQTDNKTNLNTNLDNDDKTNKSDPLVQKVEKWAEEDAKQIVEEHKKASEGAKETYKDNEGNTHYISGGDEHIEQQYQNADIVSEAEAEAYNSALQQQSSQPSEPAPAPAPEPEAPAPAPEPEYTHEDPTTSESFAPAYEEEVDAIIESMASESSYEETSEEMTR